MQVCVVSLPACEISAPAPLACSYACSTPRPSKFKAQCPSPIPSLNMRCCCLPYLPPAWQLGCRGVMERKAVAPLPCREVMGFLPVCDQGEHTCRSCLAPCLAPILLTLYQSSEIFQVSYTVKKLKLAQYTMLRTAALKTEYF